MTTDCLRQRRPDRRFRRLLPVAVAAVTLASSAPFVVPAAAHAETKPPRQERRDHARPTEPGKIPTTLRVDTTRGLRVQAVSAT